MKSKFAGLFGALIVGVLATPAHAGPIVGGSTLLNAPFVTQLETWLGAGPQTFTNIFTKTPGATSSTFHVAADGQGATFSVIEAFENGNRYVIGGYNPQSWSSIGNYNNSVLDAQRTAFIFNLTTNTLFRQDLGNNTDCCGNTGIHQTYNSASYGPTFGGGHDLYVASNLSSGYAVAYSYCPVGQTGCYQFGAPNDPNIVGSTGNNFHFDSIGALEVFTIAPFSAPPSGAPAPGALAMVGLGLLGVSAMRRRSAR